ncbi:MAG: c-type cytochrome, partial [Verrucomicrobiaceae bacterium]
MSPELSATCFVGILLMLGAPWGSAQSAAYRDLTMTREGNIDHGRQLFTNYTCAQCHSLDGSGDKAGPDLSSVGDKFDKADLIRSIMEPSVTIAVGHDNTLIRRKDGTTVAGVIRQATSSWIELMPADGKALRVAIADIESRETSPVSMMPENLYLAGTPEDFSDLVTFLGSLRQVA